MTCPIVSQASGHVAVGPAIRKPGVSGTFLRARAHLDDQTNTRLGLRRPLPAGTGGGYRLLAIPISLPRVKEAR